MPDWEIKYSVEGHWPFGYRVVTDGCNLAWCAIKSDAERLCSMLNGAWNLGHIYGYMDAKDGNKGV